MCLPPRFIKPFDAFERRVGRQFVLVDAGEERLLVKARKLQAKHDAVTERSAQVRSRLKEDSHSVGVLLEKRRDRQVVSTLIQTVQLRERSGLRRMRRGGRHGLASAR